ncbi:MAG: hypothetical protein WBG75_04295, partial [Mycolicibacter algericus]|uniref:hypothetical protein n=1 Tax=Mycolicibacter algericus TaxID=1288388 RepID=UPI003C71B562
TAAGDSASVPAHAAPAAEATAATTGPSDAHEWTFEDMVATAFPELSAPPAQPAEDRPTEVLAATPPPEDETEH